jgi:hypothetical protein
MHVFTSRTHTHTHSIQQECNQFLKKKVFDWQSAFQSDSIPIPRFAPKPQVRGWCSEWCSEV